MSGERASAVTIGEGPYLEHFAQLLSQRNFVNDMGAELDEARRDARGEVGGDGEKCCDVGRYGRRAL